MRTRTAKKLAQRIDLNYFKRSHPLRRWRTILSIVAPVTGLLWLGGMALAGSRAPYSSGPVSSAHAFAEKNCEVCHVRQTSFRAHVADQACVTCHDGPPHSLLPRTTRNDAEALPRNAAPSCATCHREHEGRVGLALTADEYCVDCHGGSSRVASKAASVEGFPDGHPAFAPAQAGYADPATIKFNHEVHAKPDLRGPNGPEKLACTSCHRLEIARGSARSRLTGLMQPVAYEQQCARCHPLFFDERIDAPAPHDSPSVVRAFVERALREHITKNPADISVADEPQRRVPLNFPRAVEPPARTPDEWVTRRAARAERLLWGKTCVECHQVSNVSGAGLPSVAPANIRSEWMSKASFDHGPHMMVRCQSCHAAEESRQTSDVLMPSTTSCATCHASDKGASSACVECHAYHDWSKAKPVDPHFSLEQFRTR